MRPREYRKRTVADGSVADGRCVGSVSALTDEKPADAGETPAGPRKMICVSNRVESPYFRYSSIGETENAARDTLFHWGAQRFGTCTVSSRRSILAAERNGLQ